jgi:hypothetical protein
MLGLIIEDLKFSDKFSNKVIYYIKLICSNIIVVNNLNNVNMVREIYAEV